ncbi:hypothetical protein GCM10009738_26040 [Kitasatospora viridis]
MCAVSGEWRSGMGKRRASRADGSSEACQTCEELAALEVAEGRSNQAVASAIDSARAIHVS